MNTLARSCLVAFCAGTVTLGPGAARAEGGPESVAAADTSTVLVHVEGPGARLVRYQDALSARRHEIASAAPICVAPCDVRVPRNAWYVIADRRSSAPFTLASSGDHARIEVRREPTSRATAAAIVLGATAAVTVGLIGVGYALDEQSKHASSTCSGPGLICMSDASGDQLAAVFFYFFAGVVGTGGLITSLVLFARPSTTTTVHVGGGETAASSASAAHAAKSRFKWTPTLAAIHNGASIGLHAEF